MDCGGPALLSSWPGSPSGSRKRSKYEPKTMNGASFVGPHFALVLYLHHFGKQPTCEPLSYKPYIDIMTIRIVLTCGLLSDRHRAPLVKRGLRAFPSKAYSDPYGLIVGPSSP